MSNSKKCRFGGRPVSIRRIECLPQLAVYVVEAELCRRRVRWELTLYLGGTAGKRGVVGADVTPLLASMEGVEHCPYDAAARVLAMGSSSSGVLNINDTLMKIAEELTLDFVEQQKKLVNSVMNISDGLRFLVDMLKDIPQAALLVEASGGQLSVEFPLLDATRLQHTHTGLQYLCDVLDASPITVCISLSCSSSGQVTTNPSLVFPDTLPCCRVIDVPKWNFEKLTIFEYITQLEKLVLSNWEVRHLFMNHLQKISAVYEFDAIDFSYAAFVLRAKQKNMFSMCSIEVKLTSSFPKEPPMVTFFDMKTSLSTIVDPAEIIQSNCFGSSWAIESMADGIFLFCWEKLLFMSFGTINIK
jgi:hypothetical protein